MKLSNLKWQADMCDAEAFEEGLLVPKRITATATAHGPDYDLARTRDPLLRSLVRDGLAVPDAHGLGLRTGRHGTMIDAEGWPATNLRYVGPMLRADHWEATAAAELAVHAQRLAELLRADREAVSAAQSLS